MPLPFKKKITTMDEHATQIKSEDDTEIAAQKIFENVARRNELIRLIRMLTRYY
jgi:hypothetical protein